MQKTTMLSDCQNILVTVLLKMTLCLCIYFVFTKNPLF